MYIFDEKTDQFLQRELGAHWDARELKTAPHPVRMEKIQGPMLLDQATNAITDEILASGDDLYSPSAWAKTSAYVDLAARLGATGQPRDQISVFIQQLYFGAVYRHAGRKLYYVAKELAARLRQTHVKGVSPDYLRLPFRALYLQIPASAGLEVWNQETGLHVLEGCYVAEVAAHMGDGDRSLKLMAIGRSKPTGRGLADDAVLYFTIPLSAKTIEHCIAETAHLVMKDHENPTWRHQVRDIFLFVMNTVLYMSSIDADIVEQLADPRRRKLLARLQKTASPAKRRHIKRQLDETGVGSVLSLGPHLRTLATEPIQDATRPATWSPTAHGFRLVKLVQGHWKTVPSGKGLVIRTVRWISPYRRGQWVLYGGTDGFAVR